MGTRRLLKQLISGGQSGADRAALDAALEFGIEVGGWVPRGRWAEDGALPERYRNMVETDSADPAERTECNVRDADATVVFSHGPPRGGSALTVTLALRLSKPLLHLDLATVEVERAGRELREWIAAVEVAVLNVAGPRASKDPKIYGATRAVLHEALRDPVGQFSD